MDATGFILMEYFTFVVSCLINSYAGEQKLLPRYWKCLHYFCKPIFVALALLILNLPSCSCDEELSLGMLLEKVVRKKTMKGISQVYLMANAAFLKKI